MLPAIAWKNGALMMVDQRRLPWEEEYLTLKTVEEVARAIENMAIRGAPAIGIAAAYGLALGIAGLKRGLTRRANLAGFTSVCGKPDRRPETFSGLWRE